jgi:hypothetical protein
VVFTRVIRPMLSMPGVKMNVVVQMIVLSMLGISLGSFHWLQMHQPCKCMNCDASPCETTGLTDDGQHPC